MLLSGPRDSQRRGAQQSPRFRPPAPGSGVSSLFRGAATTRIHAFSEAALSLLPSARILTTWAPGTPHRAAHRSTERETRRWGQLSKVTVRSSAELESLELLLPQPRRPSGREDAPVCGGIPGVKALGFNSAPPRERGPPAPLHVPQARATPPAEGRGCPEDQPQCGGCVRPPSALPRLSWGGSPGLPKEPPSPGCPAPALPGAGPPWRRLRRPCRVTAEVCAPLDQDPAAQGQRCLMLRHCLSSSRSMRL